MSRRPLSRPLVRVRPASVLILAAIAAGSVAGGGFARQSEGTPPKGEGVCSFTETTVTCWGMDRRRRKDLEGPVLRALSSPGSSYQTIFRFGFKNRLLVLREPRANAWPFEFDAGRTPPRFQTNEDSFGEPLTILAVAAARERTEGVIRYVVSRPVGNPIVIPFVEGAEYRQNGVAIKMGKPLRTTTDAPPSFYGGTGGGPERDAKTRPVWSATAEITAPAGTQITAWITPVDRKDAIVANVDSEGRPAPVPADAANPNRGWNNGYIPPLAQIAVTPGLASDSGASTANAEITSYVDPKELAGLRWTITLSRRVELPPFPLDPK